jgi:hypothetical protein
MTRTIILEGPDGSGKSTLAKKIGDEFKAQGCTVKHTHHGLYMKETGSDLLWIYTKSILDESADVHIIDRCYLSEPVYGSVMRGVDRLGPHGCTLLHRLCQARGVVEAVCLPPWPTVLTNWSEKRKSKWDPTKGTGDYVDAREKAYAIFKSYQEILKCPDQVPFNYLQHHSIGYLVGSEPKPFYQRGVIGPTRAEFLIVGEQVNLNKENSKFDLPFYELNSSSLFLNRMLEIAGVDDDGVAFTNALTLSGTCTDEHRHRRKHSGERDLRSIVGCMPEFIRCVALGKTAARVCQSQGLPFVELRHPSYVKRFFLAQHEAYAQQLKEACQ